MIKALTAAALSCATTMTLAQTLACNPSSPRTDPGTGFVTFGANEQLLSRGGNAGPAWEWAVGTDTEAGQKVQGNLDWISGRSYQWSLSYSGSGAATVEVRDQGTLVLSLSYPSGMDSGNALHFQVGTNTSIGSDTTISASVTSIAGQAASGSLSQTGNNQEALQDLYFYFPGLSQGSAASGTVTLTYATLPTGGRVHFKVRAGNVPCNNAAPTVSVSAPSANQLFHAPASISISASAADSDGTVAQVEFFANGSPLGTATAAPFSINWANVAAGSYSLTARAHRQRRRPYNQRCCTDLG